MPEQDYEQNAREQGWKPESEWKGDPPSGGFKSAEQFVKDGEQIPGILKSQIGRLEERLSRSEAANAEFKQYTDKQIGKEKAKNDSLIDELQKVRAQAITDGDGTAAVNAEIEIKNLEVAEPVPDNAEAYNRLSQQWATENSWYATNNKLGRFADGIAEGIVQQGYTGQAYFNELTRQVKETFPEEFTNPRRSEASSVEDGGNRDTGGDGQSWADLPAEDKAKAESFISEIPGFTKEQFLDQYDWE